MITGGIEGICHLGSKAGYPTNDFRQDPTWDGCRIAPMISGGIGRIPPGI